MVYDFETGTFSKQTSEALSTQGCNDPVNHVKATLNVTGLPEDCATVRAAISAQAQQFAAGSDTGATYDPHGTGKGYAVAPDTKGDAEMEFVRFAGVCGKGLAFYQDTVLFQFRDTNHGCDFDAASQSQVSAGGDAGTNACNIFNLVSKLASSHGQLQDLVATCCTSSVPCALSNTLV